jgi:hypothetical protein
MKMKRKTMFCMLSLCLLSVASVNAQVRIGGAVDPNPSAVLDLNANDVKNDGVLGLALPRVVLTSTANYAPLKTHVAGMLVYNTGTGNGVTPGTYYNDGSKWIRVESGTLAFEGVISTAVIDATSGGGLTRAGAGTETAPYTLGIADGGVTSAKIANETVMADDLASNAVTTVKIADGAVSADKLNAMSATNGQVLKYNGSAWAPASDIGLTLEADGVIGNEVIDATSGGGLTRAGAGTTASPYTLGIADNGVTTAKINANAVTGAKIADGTIATADLADGAVTAAKLNAMSAASGQVLKYNGSSWAASTLTAAEVGASSIADCPYLVVNGVREQKTSGYLTALPDQSRASAVYSYFNSIAGSALCIAPYDFIGKSSWSEATAACAKLGTGWRLPTLGEMTVFPVSRFNLVTDGDFYWSSTEYSNSHVWVEGYHNNLVGPYNRTSGSYVRCVRSL